MPRFRWDTRLLANEASGPNARLRVRPRLTVARWPGDIDAAGQISDKLVDNAARHGKPFGDGFIGLRLTVLQATEELRIEVDDADPAFPGFGTAASAPRPQGRGLWWVQQYGGRLTWDVKVDDDGRVAGKTVTAVLHPAGETESV
ncbi:ATP-binding protein [Streptomyces sp. NPDC005017]|uniref:ATP-binding protein n=1 Tax=Streptomyces sp. NPDC005017 TaxID=3364706 RepID=UPI0036769CCF